MTFEIKKDKKEARLAKIRAFESTLGRGDTNLSEIQKKARISKVLGYEQEKIKGFGEDKEKGIKFFKKTDYVDKIDIESPIDVDPIPSLVLDNLETYPDDPYRVLKDGKSKVLNVEIEEDGALIMEGIHIDGKEKDPKIRSRWILNSIGDIDAARSEMYQFKEGKLKTVSDRTMAIHKDNGDLDKLFDDPDIDTDEDKEIQY